MSASCTAGQIIPQHRQWMAANCDAVLLILCQSAAVSEIVGLIRFLCVARANSGISSKYPDLQPFRHYPYVLYSWVSAIPWRKKVTSRVLPLFARNML